MEKTTTIIKNRYTLAEEHKGLESTYIPPRGCTVIYPAEDGYQKVKLGDGVTTLAELPWCGNESDLDAILEEAKAYTDNEIATFDFIKVVNALPETGLLNKIYLVPNTANTENNLFDEWIWINKGTESAPEYAWEWITTKQVEVDLHAYATKEYVDSNKTQIVTTTGSGSAYVATVPGITSLTTGISFVMVPHVTSASTSPTLNVNNLGVKSIRRISSYGSTTTYTGAIATWLSANKPLNLIYDGTYWIVQDMPRPNTAELVGTVSVSKGGIGTSTLTSNAIITGNGTSAVKTVSTASGALYATAANGAAQFGTLPIAQGGTGATTAADALTNLGAASATHTHAVTTRFIRDDVVYNSCYQTITGFLVKDESNKSFRFSGSVCFTTQGNADNYEVWSTKRIAYYLLGSENYYTNLAYLQGYWWGGSNVSDYILGYGTRIEFTENPPYMRFHRYYTSTGTSIGGWNTKLLSENAISGKVLHFEIVGCYN